MAVKLSKRVWAGAISAPLLMGGCSTVRIVEKEVCDTACQVAVEKSERLGIVQALNSRVQAFEQAGDTKNANATALVLTHYIRGTDPAMNDTLKEHIKRDTLTDEFLQKMADGLRFDMRVVPCQSGKTNKTCAVATPASGPTR